MAISILSKSKKQRAKRTLHHASHAYLWSHRIPPSNVIYFHITPAFLEVYDDRCSLTRNPSEENMHTKQNINHIFTDIAYHLLRGSTPLLRSGFGGGYHKLLFQNSQTTPPPLPQSLTSLVNTKESVISS